MNQQSGPTVLIVDDEPFGRDSLEMLLLNQGYSLAFAANGAEALAKAAELVPDLILLDVMMPDMDGFEVCRRLRSDVVLSDVPVVLVTALDDRDSRLLGIEAGADDFITKPFDRVELRTRVNTITRLNRFRRILAERTKFEWVVEQADDGYLIIDDAGVISYANTKARLYLGLPLETSEPISATFHQIIRQQYHIQPETAWAIWPDANHDTPRYLVRPETASSRPFWLQVEALQSNLSTDSPWVVHLRDVTAQMEHTNDKWHFHAMISHKFRTPLIPLVTGIDLLRNHNDGLSPEEIISLAELAANGINRLQRTIEDVLSYLNTPKSNGSIDGFSLGQFRSVVGQISVELQLNNLAVTFSGGLKPEQVKLLFSPTSAEIMLREVLENSKKFHPVHNPRITISVEQSGYSPFIVIRIADDGVTMSSEQLAQVWIPYYQGEKYFTGEITGMGLGLSMVAAAVWNAGGKCHIYNRSPGPGIVTEFSLPYETICEESYAEVEII